MNKSFRFFEIYKIFVVSTFDVMQKNYGNLVHRDSLYQNACSKTRFLSFIKKILGFNQY